MCARIPTCCSKGEAKCCKHSLEIVGGGTVHLANLLLSAFPAVFCHILYSRLKEYFQFQRAHLYVDEFTVGDVLGIFCLYILHGENYTCALPTMITENIDGPIETFINFAN